jgi:hypothetical protein
VIVLNGAWPQPVHDRSRLESYLFFNAATNALSAANKPSIAY